MYVRKLTEGDARNLWEIRLYALETEPGSFGESLEELRKKTVEEYESGLRNAGPDNFVFGAFDGEALVGMSGFYREKALKLKHKGHVWGVFVHPSMRGKGIGRNLLTGVVQEARSLSGMRCLLLTVASTQTAARSLYEKVGFRSFGREPGSLKVGDRYVDEDHMILEFAAQE